MADYKPRMKAKYDDEIVKAMTEKFGYTPSTRTKSSRP